MAAEIGRPAEMHFVLRFLRGFGGGVGRKALCGYKNSRGGKALPRPLPAPLKNEISSSPKEMLR